MGDVQGCADELDALLERAEARFGQDFELWVVGDLINRGPDNLRPLDRVRNRVEAGRARYVLGNHEISLLRCWLGLRPVSPFDSFQDVLDRPDASEWVAWLRSRPLVESGRVAGQDFAMVHASVHPEWSLRELESAGRRVEAALQAPGWEAFLGSAETSEDALGRLTRCRSVDGLGTWSSELPEADPWRPWHRAWAERGHPYGVVYGHWAMQGLHVEDGLRGLDTGCVHHGRGRDGYLTAWLPDEAGERPFGAPDDRFWAIPARRAYYAQRDATS